MSGPDESQVSCLDEEYKLQSVVCKRRSSIFCRQNITCDRQERDEVTNHEIGLTSDKNEGDTQADAETFNLEEYIGKLKQERINWQQEYKNRRRRLKDLTKQKTIADRQGQLLDINVLTESEKAFIKARPNYENICKNIQKLSDVALKISMLSQIVHKSYQRFTEKMESNISRATKDIVEMSKH